MKCERCGQFDATVHEVMIRGGKKTERHLCEQCAANAGMSVQPQADVAQVLASLMTQQVAGLAAPLGASGVTETRAACDVCGMTFSEFRKGGLLGCPACYLAFECQLDALVQRIQEGGTRHVGKVPRRLHAMEQDPEGCDAPDAEIFPAVDEHARAARIEAIRRQLREAVEAEAYERAASLRDQLAAISRRATPRSHGGPEASQP